MESYKRTYVAVNADFRADGLILPRSISWYDDHKYQIDRVIRVGTSGSQKSWQQR
jgi:purine-nucleoside phosphorylase